MLVEEKGRGNSPIGSIFIHGSKERLQVRIIEYVAAAHPDELILSQQRGIDEKIVHIRGDDKRTATEIVLGPNRGKNGRGVVVNDVLDYPVAHSDQVIIDEWPFSAG